MTLNYQRWSPDTCECSFQQEVNSKTGEINVLFAYKVCDKHKSVAVKQKSKTTLISNDFIDMKIEVIDKINLSLQENRVKNLEDYDKHPKIKQALLSANELKKEIKTEKHALTLESRVFDDRTKIKKSLDEHENRVINTILEAFGEPHSLSCGDVYNEVLKEQKQKNNPNG